MTTINSIEIRGLFDDRDIRADLPVDESLAFLYGANGAGKSTILRVADHLLQKSFRQLSKIPFRSAEIVLSNRTKLRIEREDHGGSLRLNVNGYEVPIPRVKYKPERRPILAEIIDEVSTGITRIDRFMWFDDARQIELSLDDAVELYSDELPAEDVEIEAVDPRIESALGDIRSILIPASRLYRSAHTRFAYGSSLAARTRLRQHNLSEQQGWVASAINSALRQYADESRILEQSFPIRILDREEPGFSIEETRRLYEKVSEAEASLTKVGLAVSGEKLPRVDLDYRVKAALDRDPSAERIAIVHEYLSDALKKLDRVKAVQEKLELFLGMLNSQFSRKEVVPDPVNGFRIKAGDRDLSISDLSSGEQHQLYLASALLFREQQSAIVMIDEPELSLHVSWQEDLSDTLIRVAELAGHSFVLATHSPTIIGDRWDLAVELSVRES